MIKDLYRMAVFAKVVERGSFSAAAESLGLGKSVVSEHIRALERSLGIQLLNRSTRSLSLTEEGRRFYEPCLRIVQEAESAYSDIESQKQTPRGKIRLTASYNLGINLLIPTLNKFMLQNPEVTIDLDLDDSITNIIEEGFDLALRAGWLVDSRLHAVKLTKLELPICAAPSYLSRNPAPTTPEEIVHHRWVGISLLPHAEKITLENRNGQRRAIKVLPSVTVNSGVAAKEFLLAGAGIGVVPDYAVRKNLADGQLVRILPEWATQQGTVSAVFPHKDLLSPKIRSLVEFLRIEFKSLSDAPEANASASVITT